MSNRIDRLFKDALSEHNIPPSAEAWTKVQSAVSKKNKIIIVWRAAAVFVLCGVLIGTWYLLNHDESITPGRLTEKTEVVTPEKNSIDNPVESTHENPQPNLAQTTKSENQKKRNERPEVNKRPQNPIKETTAMQDGESAVQVEEIVISAEPTQIAQTTKQEKPIVIEFTLPSLSKEPVVEVAQTSEEESSGLKKVLETALEVKNGESDFSIIRDARNQLFALDFKKDKTKRN